MEQGEFPRVFTDITSKFISPTKKEVELSTEEDKKKKEKLQRDSDMAVAMETFGISKPSGIEGMEPSSEEEFTTFRDALADKIVCVCVCVRGVCVCVCVCVCVFQWAPSNALLYHA